MSLQRVIHERKGVEHEDDRRALITVFNGDLDDFVAKQVKLAVLKQDAILGGHYHMYDELFYLLEGEGAFALTDPAIPEVIQHYDMIKGDRLFVPRGIAHKAYLRAGSILVGCTEEPYLSPEHNDHKYEF